MSFEYIQHMLWLKSKKIDLYLPIFSGDLLLPETIKDSSTDLENLSEGWVLKTLFLVNTEDCSRLPQEAIGPKGVQLLLEGGPYQYF